MGLSISYVPVKRSNLTLNIPKKKIGSKQDAHDAFGQTKQQLIALGRRVAWKLTATGGTVTTRDVRRVMIDEGLYKPSDEMTEHWLGFVFHEKRWKWTGQWAKYSTPPTAKKTQGAWRTVRVWRRT